MRFQNRVIVSLGSNQGDRLQNIQSCVNYLHSHIATVVKVSALYETPSWGFESDNFYNCAVLLHTCKKPEELLQEILQAELIAGRIRNAETTGYQARLIDIDIIAFNNEILSSDTLTVPHPRMQDRNFVLYPFRDVNSDWVHPVLKKDINELIIETSDTGEPVKVCELENPIEQFNLSKYSYIAIEGNIGSGKTSLSGKISEDFKGKLILERFADNPFLPKFYGDQERYAFSLETSFLADRYHQLSDDLAQLDLFNDFVVADYHIFKSLIFSKITLSEDEYILYRKLFDIIYKETPKPDFYVYLYQSTNTLLQQIKKRGRSYEQGIEASYLEKINEGYMEYIKSQKGANIIIIDVTNRDFVNNQEDYLWVLSQIEGNL